jgi:hypothetical protein
MSNTKQVIRHLEEILNWCGEPLKQLNVTPLETKDIEEHLARISYQVAPSYLPFATDSAGTFGIHIWPGRLVIESPLIHVSTAQQQAQFVCESFRSLPAAILLWVSAYFEEKLDVLRSATTTLASKIPGGKQPPTKLWKYLPEDLVRWSPDSPGNEAWKDASVGHPFAGIPEVEHTAEPDEALKLLRKFLLSRRNEPEVLSTFLAIQAAVGDPRKSEDILAVLTSEAWRDLSCLRGLWRERGRGICEWDCTLKNTEDPAATFTGTHFEPLIGHSDTYSGEDKEGPKRLLSIADNFHKANDPAGELRQVRNAATLAILIAGEYPLPYAERIASVCDAIEKDSLAAAIARESARVHSQGP